MNIRPKKSIRVSWIACRFKLEGYNLFVEMMAQIRRNVIYNIYVFKPVPYPMVISKSWTHCHRNVTDFRH